MSVLVKQIQLLHPQDEKLGIIVGLRKLQAKPKKVPLASLVLDSQQEVTGHLERREALRQELLTQHAQTNEDGSRKSVPLMKDGVQVVGPQGPVTSAVMKDDAAFQADFIELMGQEVELEHTFTREDFEGQPDGFSLEDEWELLGALLIDG